MLWNFTKDLEVRMMPVPVGLRRPAGCRSQHHNRRDCEGCASEGHVSLLLDFVAESARVAETDEERPHLPDCIQKTFIAAAGTIRAGSIGART
jgi:hypothetical protein